MGDFDYVWWAKACAFVMLAAIGGMLGYVMRTLDNAGVPLKWSRTLLEGFASGFVGMLVMLLCHVLGFNDQWTGVVVGVMGWLGANVSIRILESKVLKQLGLSKNKKESEDDEVAQ